MKAPIGPGSAGVGGGPGGSDAVSAVPTAPAALDGLDAVAWHGFTNPSRSEEIPDRLRDLAAPGSASDRAEALRLLGKVLRTTAHLVLAPGPAVLPFVVRLALVPGLPDRAALIGLLGEVVANHFPDEPRRGAERGPDCCAAITEAHDALVAMLADPDPEVRTAVSGLLWRYAAWAPRAGEALTALRRLDRVEADVAVRVALRWDGAEVAGAMPAAGDRRTAAVEDLCAAVAALLEPCDTDRDASALELARLWGLRHSGASALEDSDAAWPALLAAATSPATPREAYPIWTGGGSGLAVRLTEDHLPRRQLGTDPRWEPRPAAIEAITGIVGALAARPEAAVRRGALQAAGDAITRVRGTAPVLLPVIVAGLDDLDAVVRDRSADLLGALAAASDPRNGAVAAYADRLAELLDDPEPGVAAQAANALAAGGDARALPAVLRALDGERPGLTRGPDPDPADPPWNHVDSWDRQRYAFREADVLGYAVPALAAADAAHADQLAPALRDVIVRYLSMVEDVDGSEADVETSRRDHRIEKLVRALATCGPAAAVATPELTAELSRRWDRDASIRDVLHALAAAGPGARAAVPVLAEIGQAALARFEHMLHHGPHAHVWPQVGYQEPMEPRSLDSLSVAAQAAATRFAIDADGPACLAALDAVAAALAELERLRDATVPASQPDGKPARHRRQSLNGKVVDCGRLADLAAGYGGLGPAVGAERMVPLLRHLDTGERLVWRNADVWIAWAHWRATGERQIALDVYVGIMRRSSLSPSGDRWLPALRRFAGLVPPPGHPLDGILAAALRDLTDGETRIEFNGDGARARIAKDEELRRRAAEALADLALGATA